MDREGFRGLISEYRDWILKRGYFKQERGSTRLLVQIRFNGNKYDLTHRKGLSVCESPLAARHSQNHDNHIIPSYHPHPRTPSLQHLQPSSLELSG